MSSSEAFNFGRKIKDLKRNYNKTYADLTAALKISRERIVQLEENEREPTEIERRRFAEFYGLPPEELGLFGPGTGPQPNRGPQMGGYSPGGDRPAYPSQPSYGDRPTYRSGGNYEPRQSGGYEPRANPGSGNYDQPERRPNYEPRQGGSGYDRQGGYDQGNYEPRQGGYDRPGGFERQGGSQRPQPGNYNERPQRPQPGNYNERPQRPQPGNYNERPQRPQAGNFNERPQQRPGPGRVQDEGDRPLRPAQVKPAQPARPKPEKPAQTGEPKPVMKYTAEQLGDIESAYLRKQRDLKVPLKFTFMNGQEYTGVVVDFTPFTVHIIEQETGEEVILRKLAMAYYRKADALEEARAAGQNQNNRPED